MTQERTLFGGDAYAELVARQDSRSGRPSRKGSRPRSSREDRVQSACVYWFRLQYPGHSRLLFHVPNGGFRIASEASRLHAMGVVAGVADLILLEARGGHGALCIEMKTTDKGSRQSAQQVEWQQAAERVGNLYVVCRTFEEFKVAVDAYMALPLAAAPKVQEVEF